MSATTLATVSSALQVERGFVLRGQASGVVTTPPFLFVGLSIRGTREEEELELELAQLLCD
jgi:hypothetical protein